MKISITPPSTNNGTQPVLITGSVPKELPSGLRINGKRLLQVSETYRGIDVKVFNRKNFRNMIEFYITRSHGTLAAAELFILTHEDSLPNVGLITFTLDNNSELYMRGGLESVNLAEQIGETTKFSYSIVGGKITNSLPAANRVNQATP